MSKFKEGEQVQSTRGVFLHKGVIVQANAVLTVQKVNDHGDGVLTYDVRFLDREQQPHTIPGVKESELKAATASTPPPPAPNLGRPPAFDD